MTALKWKENYRRNQEMETKVKIKEDKKGETARLANTTRLL